MRAARTAHLHQVWPQPVRGVCSLPSERRRSAETRNLVRHPLSSPSQASAPSLTPLPRSARAAEAPATSPTPGCPFPSPQRRLTRGRTRTQARRATRLCRHRRRVRPRCAPRTPGTSILARLCRRNPTAYPCENTSNAPDSPPALPPPASHPPNAHHPGLTWHHLRHPLTNSSGHSFHALRQHLSLLPRRDGPHRGSHPSLVALVAPHEAEQWLAPLPQAAQTRPPPMRVLAEPSVSCPHSYAGLEPFNGALNSGRSSRRPGATAPPSPYHNASLSPTLTLENAGRGNIPVRRRTRARRGVQAGTGGRRAG